MSTTVYRLLVQPHRIPDEARPHVPPILWADTTVGPDDRLGDLAASVLGTHLAITQRADVLAECGLAPEVADDRLDLIRVPIHEDDGTLLWADAVTHPVAR